ncbi:putative Cytochrome P450, family 87, subfamily A, polypeptide 6 [Heracleum sosnowskyi]|uniref:Cytochrome P450, family 87, subfamily A, polypeptide 6 n=1 Tax=Heracleum sosnowskyi TaxID=360622 RepID=A0AAD8J935_9APIA|nr:putative Cytochrome P450, family 87, subfamily A, polypeptide 6 [Heracleum sosnowskyi]
METWLIIIVSVCITIVIKSILTIIQSSSTSKKLPPGPTKVPIIGSFIWLHKSYFNLEPILHDLKLKYGPIFTLKIGSRPVIYIASHSSAHRALVQAGAIFSDRPRELSTGHIINSHHRNIITASYGSTWRLFRRNMAENMIHSVRLKTFSDGRKWALGILLQRLFSESESGGIKVVDHFHHAMFSLLGLMCFGEKIKGEKIREIEMVHRKVLMSVAKFGALYIWPKLGRIVFWKQRKELTKIREDQDSVLIPMINARREKVMKQKVEEDDVMAYVDSLVDLKLPEEGNRKLYDQEIIGLCEEFLNVGTDTATTSLQWIMANLVKYPQVQEKLFQEIITAVGLGVELVVTEEELQRLPYLKAVVLETLRLHPPTHLVVPHSVTEEVELDGYLIPKNAEVNFMVAAMGRDAEVWEYPTEFRPERFLNGNGGEEGFDITCRREIKMMPFGAGRRICPGYTMALLHLEYFVANLVVHFEWKPAIGNYDVDLSENQEFTVGMKNPLLVCISPRVKLLEPCSSN